MLYNNNSASFVLGSLLNNPTLLFNDKYKISKKDFEPVLFQKIVFVAIQNLSLKNIKEIDSISVCEFLKNHKSQYEVFKSSNGEKYIQTVKELSKESTFDYYYEKMKVFSVLREYKKQGFDIAYFFDDDKNESEQIAKLETIKSKDIIDYFEKKHIEVKKEFEIDLETESMIVGEDIETLLEDLQEQPMLGASMRSGMRNSLYRGLCRGHLFLVGSPSSFGKTTIGISDAVLWGSKKILKDGIFVDNEYYAGKTAYIHTEQKMRKEIAPRILSTLSEVPYDKILDSNYSSNERERVLEAGHILKDSEFKLINYPNFTASGLKNRLRELSLDGYAFVVFDYCWLNGFLAKDIKDTLGIANASETFCLIHLANTLKISAEEFNLGIYTMEQLNESYKIKEFLDASCLYGSANVQSKLDGGLCYAPIKAKELAMISGYIDKFNFDNGLTGDKAMQPTACSHCFKTRWSRYGRALKIYHHVDNSIGRITDMFATDEFGNYVQVPSLYIKNRGVQNIKKES